jgi:hypothetical protein
VYERLKHKTQTGGHHLAQVRAMRPLSRYEFRHVHDGCVVGGHAPSYQQLSRAKTGHEYLWFVNCWRCEWRCPGLTTNDEVSRKGGTLNYLLNSC